MMPGQGGLLGMISPQTLPITYGLLASQQEPAPAPAPTGFFDSIGQKIQSNLPQISAGLAMMGAGQQGQAFGSGALSGLQAFSSALAGAEQQKQKIRQEQMQQLEMALRLDEIAQKARAAGSGMFAGDSIEAQVMNELVAANMQRGLDLTTARRAAIDQYNGSKATTTLDPNTGLPITFNRNPLFGGAAPPPAASISAPMQPLPAMRVSAPQTPDYPTMGVIDDPMSGLPPQMPVTSISTSPQLSGVQDGGLQPLAFNDVDVGLPAALPQSIPTGATVDGAPQAAAVPLPVRDLSAMTPVERKAYKEAQARALADRDIGMSGADVFKREKDLRSEFQSQIKPIIDVSNSYEKALKASQSDTAQGDIALIFSFMKILDPDSAVRESEYATAENAASIPDRVKNIFNRTKDGTRLTAAQRANIMAEIGNSYEPYRKQYQQHIGMYSELASKYGLDPEKVTVVPELPEILRPQKETKAVQEMTDDEILKLLGAQ